MLGLFLIVNWIEGKLRQSNSPRFTLLLGDPLELLFAGLRLLVVLILFEGLLPLPREESVLSDELLVILVLVSV